MNDNNRDQATGHVPTLIASFLHFDISFALWVLLGALGAYIADSVGLKPAEKGLMVAVPILSGAVLRVPLGVLSDRIGGKRVGIAMLGFLFLPLALGWQMGGNLYALVAIGLMLGTAGASFSVALPLASRWYPAERQGLVMGIAAAGNSGTVIANLSAPRLAGSLGWHNVLGLAMIPLAVVLIAFSLMARDNKRSSVGKPLTEYLSALRHKEMWWFSFFYSVTFGGYVGLSSFLPTFFRDQYKVSPATAGYITALAAFIGSAVRPLGGYLSDRFGGTQMLTVVLAGIATAYGLGSTLPDLRVMAAIIIGAMVCLGLGNGSVFQLVPLRFPREIGVATGVVGAVGGLGGFLLPNLLGTAKQVTGSFNAAFVILAVLAVTAVLLLHAVAVRQPRALPVASEASLGD